MERRHIRDIVKQVDAFAILHGEKVKAGSIASFVPQDRSLSPPKSGWCFGDWESVATYPTIRLALRPLLTLIQKRELVEVAWKEIDFENASWTIPKQPMKGRNPHVVYLSRQTGDIFIALHT